MIHQATIDIPCDLLDLHALEPGRYPHLLDSCASGPQGRYDILFACPGESIVLRDIDSFEFLAALENTPGLETEIVRGGGAGVSVSYKRGLE